MSDTDTKLALYAPLTDREKVALEVYEQRGGARIAPATQAQFYSLFLRGKTCDEIADINKGFALGAIIKARVEGDWDRKLDEYRESLFKGVRERLQQIELESVGFLTDMLAAAHRQQGDKLKKYIQTGDESELGDMKISSIKNYKEVLELLIKATGQERQQTIEHRHHVTASSKEEGNAIDITSLASASSNQALEIFKVLDKK
jgi:hypothetical protein